VSRLASFLENPRKGNTMKNINLLLKKNKLDSFSNRELSILVSDLSRKGAWQFLKRLEKYGTVEIQTKIPVVFWKIKDIDDFLKELERC